MILSDLRCENPKCLKAGEVGERMHGWETVFDPETGKDASVVDQACEQCGQRLKVAIGASHLGGMSRKSGNGDGAGRSPIPVEDMSAGGAHGPEAVAGVLGLSAGGLEALDRVVRLVPVGMSAAFVDVNRGQAVEIQKLSPMMAQCRAVGGGIGSGGEGGMKN